MTGPTTSIVRRIWSDPSCVLAIFAGSSAEFAVNPEAEWLFYTGRLPADPIGRFVSTTQYTRRLIFAPTEADYLATVREIRNLHAVLEAQRERSIPTTAYMDVLFMNIEYSMRAFRLVFGRDLSDLERNSVVAEFRRVGELMHIPMPRDLIEYEALRAERLASFGVTEWTPRLMLSYRRALGRARFSLLKVVYGAVVDPCVLQMLGMEQGTLARAFAAICPYVCKTSLDRGLTRLVCPDRMARGLTG
jgi:hypothetical protein